MGRAMHAPTGALVGVVVLLVLVAACLFLRVSSLSKVQQLQHAYDVLAGEARYDLVRLSMSQLVLCDSAADAAGECSLSGSRTSSSLAVCNPCMLDDANLLVRLCPFHYCHHGVAPTNRDPRSDYSVVWIRDEVPVLRIPNAEDGRAFRLDGELYCIFSRCFNGLIGSRCVLVLATLTPFYSERVLRYEEARSKEKNWVPIVHGAPGRQTLYLSYSLSPRHRVLRCDPATGECVLAHETITRWRVASPEGAARAGVSLSGDAGVRIVQHAKAARPADVGEPERDEMRGGSPPVAWGDDRLLAVCHRTDSTGEWPFRAYQHAFYAFERDPPFRILQRSRWFRFPQHYHDSRDMIQFCCGLWHDESVDELCVTYGVADCVSASIRVPRRRVEELLSAH